MKITNVILTICFLFVILAGCNSKDNKSVELTVAAASDLIFAFKQVKQSFEEKTGWKVNLVFGSSGTLAQQIDNGAPFDVFASANPDYIEDLRKKGKIIPATERLYAVGSLVIVSFKEGAHPDGSLKNLVNPEIKKIAIANPEHAPYGMAAKQALQSAGIWEEIAEKLVYGKSVSETLTLVETGNAEIGLIAHSLVSDEINYTFIDKQLYKPIKQMIAVIKQSPNEKQAIDFINYVTGEEGQNILKQNGFNIPEAHDGAS